MANRSRLDRVRGPLGVIVVLGLLIGVLALTASASPGGSFTDDDGNVHEPYIEAIAAEGITKGCNPPANDLYCPSEPVTRGQMAAFMVRALGLTTGLDDPFSDDDGSVFETDIEKLAAAGITRGCNPPVNDLFCPDEYVTRGQMAAFLVRALGYTDDGGGDLFTDDDNSVFEADIDRLGTAGVTKGCNPPENTRFCPNDYVLRDQMASFLARALGLAPIDVPDPTTSTTAPATTPTTDSTPTTLPEVGSQYAEVKVCEYDEGASEFVCDVRDQASLSEGAILVNVDASVIVGTCYYDWFEPSGDSTSACPIAGYCITNVTNFGPYGNVESVDFVFHVDGEARESGWHYFELESSTGKLLVRQNFELVP